MKQVFENTQLAGVTIPNRISRSATFEGMAGNRPMPSILSTWRIRRW